jgi:hypothetical protein
MRWALQIGSIYGIAVSIHFTFLFLLAFLLSVGVLACCAPARRATKVNRWWRRGTSRWPPPAGKSTRGVASTRRERADQ